MKLCQSHWDKLKDAITDRGLFIHVAKSGEELVNKMVKEFDGDISLSNWDPLMSAHNTIVSNAFEMLSSIGVNPLILMQQHEDEKYSCPICYLNFLSKEHDDTCEDPNCTKPKGLTFDDWVEKAADGQLEYYKDKVKGVL